jgi:5-oxoprolinase (ATP-hydrolysing)
VEQAALGIHKVVVESMAAAARVHLVEKGKDPRAMRWSASAAPGRPMRRMSRASPGRREVIIPPASGAASALGFLAAPLSFEDVRSHRIEFRRRLRCGRDQPCCRRWRPMVAAIWRRRRRRRCGHRVERSADMRLVGQMHDISVPLPAGEISAATLPALREAFARTYAARYTEVFEGARFEAVNFRVRCAGPTPELSLKGAAGGADAAARIKGRRQAWFESGAVETAVYDRYALHPGDVIAGPAIIEERESTTVIAPGDRLSVDASLNLCIAIGENRAAETVIHAGMSRAEAVKRIEGDPIGLEIMWSRLVNVVEEMWLTVCRTAFSLVISEAQDFACELLDKDGETLAHSPRAMPVFNLTLPRAVKALLERYPPETLKPGDVLVTNDPWLCAGHLFDIAVVTPAFPRGAAGGADGHGRPCLRYRRHQGFAESARDLRGRLPDPADEAVLEAAAQRDPVPSAAPERAQRRSGAGRCPFLHRRQRHRRRAARRLHGRLRHGGSRRAGRGGAGPPSGRCAMPSARCPTGSIPRPSPTIRSARR